MIRDRWSISNVLRQVRGALNACERARIKYRRNADVRLRLETLVRRALREAEKQLRFAKRDVIAAREPKATERKAA